MSQEIGSGGSKACMLLKGWVKDCMNPYPHPTDLPFRTFFNGALKEGRKSGAQSDSTAFASSATIV